MNSLRGFVLVASPRIADPSFEKTVILVVEHAHHGAVGVVLNQPADDATRERWMNQVGVTSQKATEICIGGPVPGAVFALGKSGADEPQASNVSRIRAGLHTEGDLRVFLGCAGWGEGQLEEEIRYGDWYVVPATSDHLFGDSDELWRNALAEVGASVLHDLGVSDASVDPLLN